jgi:hypothetical protein
MDCRVKPGNDKIVSFASHLTHSPAARGEQHPVFSRRAAPEFCSAKNEKTPDPIPSDSRRRWYRLHLDRARLKKIRKAKRRQTRKPSVRIYGCSRAP